MAGQLPLQDQSKPNGAYPPPALTPLSMDGSTVATSDNMQVLRNQCELDELRVQAAHSRLVLSQAQVNASNDSEPSVDRSRSIRGDHPPVTNGVDLSRELSAIMAAELGDNDISDLNAEVLMNYDQVLQPDHDLQGTEFYAIGSNPPSVEEALTPPVPVETIMLPTVYYGNQSPTNDQQAGHDPNSNGNVPTSPASSTTGDQVDKKGIDSKMLHAHADLLRMKEAELAKATNLLSKEAANQQRSYAELKAAAMEMDQKNVTMDQQYEYMKNQMRKELNNEREQMMIALQREREAINQEKELANQQILNQRKYEADKLASERAKITQRLEGEATTFVRHHEHRLEGEAASFINQQAQHLKGEANAFAQQRSQEHHYERTVSEAHLMEQEARTESRVAQLVAQYENRNSDYLNVINRYEHSEQVLRSELNAEANSANVNSQSNMTKDLELMQLRNEVYALKMAMNGTVPQRKVAATATLTMTQGVKSKVKDEDDKDPKGSGGGGGGGDNDPPNDDGGDHSAKGDRKPPNKSHKDGGDDGGYDPDDDGGDDDNYSQRSGNSMRDIINQLLTSQEVIARTKEATSITLLPLPQVPNFRTWKISVRSAVVQASASVNEAWHWIREVEDPNATFAYLHYPGNQFISLDTKLDCAVQRIIKGDLLREITQRSEELTMNNVRMTGRQALWMVYQSYKTDEENGAAYDMEDLIAVTLRGNNLSQFIYEWDTVLMGLNVPCDESTKKALFKMKVNNVPKIRTELEHYSRQKPDSPDKTYLFLYNAIKAVIERERRAANRTAQLSAHYNGNPTKNGETTMPAVDPKGKGKGKTKGKVKGKKGDGKGKGNAGPIDKAKTQCTYFASKGTCRFGDNCIYAHGNRPGKPPKTTAPVVPKDTAKTDPKQEAKATDTTNAGKHFTKECPYFAKGNCTFGDKCTFLHTKKAVIAHVDFRQFTGAYRPNNTDMPGANMEALRDDQGFITVTSTRRRGNTRVRTSTTAPDYDVGVCCPTVAMPVATRWYIDTASANDIIGHHNLTAYDKVLAADKILPLSTANGPTKADKQVNITSEVLDKDIIPYVLNNSPSVLSVPKRVMEDNYDFIWLRGQSPFLVKPDGHSNVNVSGDVISLSTENGIPYVDEPAVPTLVTKGTCTMPLSIGGSSGSGGANPATPPQEVQTPPDPEGTPVTETDANGEVQHEGTTANAAEHLLTHHPKLDSCETCRRTKVNKKQRRKKENRKAREENGKLPPPAKFGEAVTMDHLVSRSDMSKGVGGETNGLLVRDLYSDYVDVIPTTTRTEGSVTKSVMEFQGPDPNQCIVKCQTDGAPELTNALANLRIYNDISTPYESQTNSYAERPIGTVLGGTRSILEHAGLEEQWWPHAVRHWCLMRNTAYSNGDTPWNKRHGKGHFSGQRIPFGSLIDFLPPKPMREALPKFAKRTMPGILLGYHLLSGARWRGDYIVAPLEDFKDSSTSTSIRTFRISTIIVPKGAPTFPLKKAKDARERTITAPPAGNDAATTEMGGEPDADVTDNPANTDDQTQINIADDDPDWELVAGRLLRRYKNTGRPRGVWPEVWQQLSYKKRKEIANAARQQATQQTSNDPDANAPASVNMATLPIPESNIIKCDLPKCHTKRSIVEFCTNEDSRMGEEQYGSDGCKITRLTIKDDVTTPEGRDKAMKAVGGKNTLLWVSIPCTGGSPWQNLNRKKPGGEERVQKHYDEFYKIWETLRCTAAECDRHGGKICIEWPTNCAYWKLPRVKEFIEMYHLQTVNIHGCALGLANEQGVPIKKPWTIATNDGYIHDVFTDKKCPGPISHPVHQKTEGKYTKPTEGYTDEMVSLVHKAWKNSVFAQKYGIQRRNETGKAIPKLLLAASVLMMALNNACVPAMPVTYGTTSPHRPKLDNHDSTNIAMVARLLTRKEINDDPDAQQAIKDEGKRLEKQGTWDINTVREYDNLVKNTKAKGEKVHVARIFPICSEKGSELKKGHPERKLKGRCVLEGSDVRDENKDSAIFNELSSSPAGLEVSKAVDCYGSIKGHSIEQCDAEQAYVQAKLGGTPTWVRLPKELRPESWAKYKDPVCLLKLALYGHPDAGGYWEAHCNKHLESVGFQPIKEWRSSYWHPQLKLLLMVYVDDFKMSGPTGNLAKGWELIRKGIKTDTPKAVDKCLGCNHDVISTEVNGATVQGVQYNMKDFMVQCVDSYLALTNKSRKDLKPVSTPFLDEANVTDSPDNEQAGTLQPIASKVLMKILYGARAARFDLLRAVSALATKVTKWTRLCDRQLHRLVCYINSSLDHMLVGYVGDSPDKLEINLYADADFAGCQDTSKSTTGVFIAITGPNTFFPLNGVSKKQSCVSHSTPEAEIVAADVAVRTEGLPALDLWETILGRTVNINFMEDNQATIQIIKTGKSPTLRHLGRTHRVNISWLSETFSNVKNLVMQYCTSDKQCADVFTKAFTNQLKWKHATSMISVVKDTKELSGRFL